MRKSPHEKHGASDGEPRWPDRCDPALERLDGPYAKTHALLNPPRRVLEQRALRGHWPRFPIDPSMYEPVFAQFSRDALRSHGSDTTYLARTIEFEVESTRRRLRCPARVLALHRCALTLILEAMNNLDDSGADMAGLRRDRTSLPRAGRDRVHRRRAPRPARTLRVGGLRALGGDRALSSHAP